MWGLTRSTRVFLRSGATDLRLGFDGLSALVKSHLGQDLLSGGLFVFCNRSRTRVKVLTFDGSGLWLCIKRLGTREPSGGRKQQTRKWSLRRCMRCSAGLRSGGKESGTESRKKA
jgi:hypothetical protein